MKIVSFFILFMPLVMLGQQNNDSWAIGFGGPEYDNISALSILPNGDIVVGGKFTDTLSIGDTTLIGVSGHNCFIAVFDSLANLKFINTIPDVEGIFDISCDDENKIYVVGVEEYKDDLYDAMFFNKYDEQTQLLISKTLAGTHVNCRDIVIDSENHLYLVGYSKDGLNSHTFTGFRSWILKADQNLEEILFKTIVYEGYSPEEVCINETDDIFITLKPGNQGEEFLIYKLNQEADTVWGKTIQPVSPEIFLGVYSTSLSADENSLLVCGRLDTPVNFHNDTIIEPNYNIDAFIARYDTEGNLIWINNDMSFGSNGQITSSIIPDENGFIVTGNFQNLAEIGDSAYLVHPMGCNHDIFIVHFDNGGNPTYFKQGGGTGNACDNSTAIIQDNAGNIYNAGGFGDVGYFGNDTIYGNFWERDCYLLKFNPQDDWIITSLSEQVDINHFEIFPNPAQNVVNINSRNGLEINEILLYNLSGQKVLHKNWNSSKIDVSSLPDGIYILELISDDTKFKKKLIIR